ncbi:MAG: CHAP domain-containing protein [Acutalibacteraceae bacterium]|nr:CHAP domain-containing protein [Acutalibacteraceae bacterium]
MSVIDRLTKIAKAEIGNNGSKYRKWFYNRTSDYYGVNWCAVFISWLYNQINGLDKYMIKTDGAGTVARYSDGKYGKWYEPNQIIPKEGDIVMFRWGGSYTDKYHSDHLGYVYKVDSSYIYTIEGNTGNNDSDYSSVMYKSYSLSNGAINGYYRPYYNEEDNNDMNFTKGDKSDGVLAYKSMLITAKKLGLITQTVNADNVFGEGTLKATKQIQTKYKLEIDGIAGKNTITALHNAIDKELTDIKNSIINSTIDYLEKELN